MLRVQTKYNLEALLSDSIQKKLTRVRKPRVHITYDVQVGEAMVKREIPFVVGVLSDLAGDRDKDKPLPKLQERKFVQVDPYNFDEVLRKISPRLELSVTNTLQKDETHMSAVLNFESLSDFSPEKVAAKVPVLKALLEKRAQLANLRSSLYGNDRLEELLKELLDATEGDRPSPTSPLNKKDDGGQH